MDMVEYKKALSITIKRHAMGSVRKPMSELTSIIVGDIVQVVAFNYNKNPTIHHRRTGNVIELDEDSNQIHVELTHEPAGLPIRVNGKPSSTKVWFSYKSLVKL